MSAQSQADPNQASSYANEPLKLLLVSPGGLGDHYHGPAISIFRMLCGLKDGLQIQVLYGSSQQGSIEPLKGEATYVGKASDHFGKSLGYLMGATWFMLRRAREFDVVLLVSMNLLTLIPGAIAHMRGVRVISRAAAIAEASTITGGSLGQRFKRTLIGKASAYLAISRGIADALAELVGSMGKVHLISNGVDVVRFSPVDAASRLRLADDMGLKPTSKMRLVCVGALGDRKGQHLVVKALALLPSDVTLLLVGPNRQEGYEQKIGDLVNELGLNDRIDCISYMKDIERAYAVGDIYLLPSVGEGMPNGMLEAMASGLVPLGTRVSGIEDLIEEGCGRFVQRDPKSIASAVQCYVDDPELLARERSAARDKITNAYDSAIISKRVFDLLSDRRD